MKGAPIKKNSTTLQNQESETETETAGGKSNIRIAILFFTPSRSKNNDIMRVGPARVYTPTKRCVPLHSKTLQASGLIKKLTLQYIFNMAVLLKFQSDFLNKRIETFVSVTIILESINL